MPLKPHPKNDNFLARKGALMIDTRKGGLKAEAHHPPTTPSGVGTRAVPVQTASNLAHIVLGSATTARSVADMKMITIAGNETTGAGPTIVAVKGHQGTMKPPRSIDRSRSPSGFLRKLSSRKKRACVRTAQCW